MVLKGEAEVFVLPEEWRGLGVRFGPFLLIQYFSKRVLELKPSRIIIEALSGATADLARISCALGIETVLCVDDAHALQSANPIQQRWNTGLLACVDYLIAKDPHTSSTIAHNFPQSVHKVLNSLPIEPQHKNARPDIFGYEAYAFGMRDHALLTAMQSSHTRYFEGCKNVLDVGSGTGVFLECLCRQQIAAKGVERNQQSAQFAKSLGLDVEVQDALTFLEQQHSCYDGIYCSHFVEHLPFDAVERLVKLIAQALKRGGSAVFVFPDPESIRSQLLGFWRDPEHVRFYHPEIIEVLGNIYGLSLVGSSQNSPARSVVPFGFQPPSNTHLLPPGDRKHYGLWSRFLAAVGIAQASEIERERAHRTHLEGVVQTLWKVNQTWAWDDNAVLHFTRR